MKNHYLTEETKKQLIEVLSEEYEKILISETISKSKASAIEKQQIAELMNYLQTQNNISYLELSEKLKWPGLGKILGKVGRVVFGPIGVGVGTAIDAWNFAKNPQKWWQEFQDDYVVPDPPSGPNWPTDWKETGIMEETKNFQGKKITEEEKFLIAQVLNEQIKEIESHSTLTKDLTEEKRQLKIILENLKDPNITHEMLYESVWGWIAKIAKKVLEALPKVPPSKFPVKPPPTIPNRPRLVKPHPSFEPDFRGAPRNYDRPADQPWGPYDYGSDDIPPGGLDEKISYENRVNVIDRLISEMNTSLVMESAELRNVFIEAISAFKDTNSTYRTVLEQFGERFFTTYIPASTFGIGENENYEQSNTELPPPENLPESMMSFWRGRFKGKI